MAQSRQRGWWYPWIFVGCMLLVIAVNAVLVVSAVGTFSGIETEDHYRKGLAYNETIAANKAQQERGWQMDLVFTPYQQTGGQHHGDLVITFVDRDGHPLPNLSVETTLFRPTHEGFDQTVNLVAREAGIYGREVTLPLSGQWEAQVRAEGDGDVFEMKRRIVVR